MTYFWLCWALVAGRGLSLAVESRDHPLAAANGLLTAVVSLAAENRPYAPGLQQLWCTGLAAPQHDQVSNLCPLHEQVDP